MAVTLTTFPPARMTGAPGYLASRFYTLYPSGSLIGTAAAVTTVDTVIYLQPFSAIDYPCPAVSLNVRTTTGAAGSSVKMAVWANSPTTKRATGLPLVGLNTGQATTGSGTNQGITISYSFLPGVTYWFGSAFTTLAPTMHTLGSATLDGVMTMGMTTVNAGIILAVRAPYTYATDIMALDLTAATFTDVGGSSGVPILFVGT